MVKGILVALVVAVIAFVIVVERQPANFRVERSIQISAPVSAVFDEVNNFHRWEAWSPWAKMDPSAKVTFDGPSYGAGAHFTWAGNSKVGQGSMMILESHPSDLIRIQLDFVKPFPASNTAEFTFKTEGPQTLVTWAMYGKNNFISKAVGLFMNCDKMIGGQFEQGLADMKTIAESDAKGKKL